MACIAARAYTSTGRSNLLSASQLTSCAKLPVGLGGARASDLRSGHHVPVLLLLLHHDACSVHVLEHIYAAATAGPGSVTVTGSMVWLACERGLRVLVALFDAWVLKLPEDFLRLFLPDFFHHQVLFEAE